MWGPRVAGRMARARVDIGYAITTTLRTVFGNLGAYVATAGVPLLFGIVITAIIGATLIAGPLAQMAELDPATVEPAEALRVALPVAGAAAAMTFIKFFFDVAGFGLGVIVATHLTRRPPAPSGTASEAPPTGGDETAPPPSLGTAWAMLKPRYGQVALALLLIFLSAFGIMLVGIVLSPLIAPPFIAAVAATYLLTMWALAGVVALQEPVDVVAALRRSRALTLGTRGPIFLVVVVFLGLQVLASLAAQGPLGLLTSGAKTAAQTTLEAALGGVFDILGSFLLATLLTVLYAQLRANDDKRTNNEWGDPDGIDLEAPPLS